MKDFIKKYQYIIYVILILIFLFAIEPQVVNEINGFIILLTFTTGVILLLLNRKKVINNKQLIIYSIISLGFIIRYYYVVKTSYLAGHDIGGLDGHANYIKTLFETGRLPVTNEWQYYHPPLWHFLCMIVMKINDLFDISLIRSFEGLQYVSLFISFLVMVVQYKILDKIKINNEAKVYMMILFALFPHYIYLAASINNDVLTLLFQTLIIYYLIEWYKNDNYENTILLALVTGLAVMTKLNGAIMAIPIMFVFIKKIVDCFKNNRYKIKQLIIKLLVFGLVSLPIGLWYQVRNYVLFEQPLGYVPQPTDRLYIGDKSINDRFLTLSAKEFMEVECLPYSDYNLPMYVIKSSMFGESVKNPLTNIHLMLLIVNLLLIGVSIIACLKYVIKHKKDILDYVLIVTWLTSMISFIYFNIKYPYGCTMDFRYILLTLFSSGIIFIKEIDSWSKKIKIPIYLSILVFGVLSFYLMFII